MSMRKYLRAQARHNMEKQGILHINKKRINPKTGKVTEKSFFADNWRKYLNQPAATPTRKYNHRRKRKAGAA